MPRKPKATDESTALVPAPLSLSLYDIEDHLQCLLDSAGMIPEGDDALFVQEKYAILEEIAEADAAGKHKRDGVAKYIRSLKAAQDAIAQEVNYLLGRKKALENHEARLRDYVIGIVEQYSTIRPGTRERKELKGNIHSLQLRQNPPSVVIEDEALVPTKFKRITVTMSLEIWQQHIEECLRMNSSIMGPFMTDVYRTNTVTISKRDIADAIEAGEEVPGVDVQFGELRLQV